MKKRIISLVLAFALCLSLNVGMGASALAAGTGTEPLKIYTVNDLLSFADRVNKGENPLDAILMADIYLIGETLLPIGRITGGYVGTFDGNGHAITNLRQIWDYKTLDDGTYLYEKGLFSHLGEGGTIKNLGVADLDIAVLFNTNYCGGVASVCDGTIINCYATGKISGTRVYGIGGIVGSTGYSASVLIQDCYSDVKFDMDPNGMSIGSIGGIAGSVWGAEQQSTTATASVTLTLRALWGLPAPWPRAA